MKKTLLLTVGIALVLSLVGCGTSKKEDTADSAHSLSDSSQKKGIKYEGTVKEDGSAAKQQLILKNLKQIGEDADAISFDEVVLLTEGVPILTAETHEKLSVDEIKAGTIVTVMLVTEPITTRSLPPQIPGNSILQILVPK
ncbi:hypothetical protein [Carnobacterium sp.]|uniref:hypothetical protein n=1 Tax=Carnobacterium sp. TaxID=48221 RepID=UPI0028AFAA8B|nr:hypothetical protein [Carnobacterium sp.]